LKVSSQWLVDRPGFRSRLNYTDASYFNMPWGEARIAQTHSDKPFPSLDQVQADITSMPCATDTERRDRALLAFTLLTGARDGAIIWLKVKHVDMAKNVLIQDAREG